MRRGFTLIELLVVMAIIALLATVLLGSLTYARVLARSAVRVNDLRTLQTTLELYHYDHGRYPSTGGIMIHDCSLYGDPTDYGHYIPDVVEEGYIPQLPHDPLDCRKYEYAYRSDGHTYTLVIEGSDPLVGFENCEYPSGDIIAICGPYHSWRIVSE